MSVSTVPIENLLNDAIMLSMNLKECETETDNLIQQTVTLNKDNENIKEVSTVAASYISGRSPRQTSLIGLSPSAKVLGRNERAQQHVRQTAAQAADRVHTVRKQETETAGGREPGAEVHAARLRTGDEADEPKVSKPRLKVD